ncbi:MAG: alpha-galactosidase [Candidatus Omnitrophica bacterium]|nr:alpha-galactosidase [Candidatus Omnitrophota bacterium]
MRVPIYIGILAAWGMASLCHASTMASTAGEMRMVRQWSAARFGDNPSADPPFSFSYNGKPSALLLKTWKAERKSRRLDGVKHERTVTYTDPATGLAVICRAVEYIDFPIVEWILHFKNTGSRETPVLENIQPLDIFLRRNKNDGEFILHHNRGSMTTPQDYEPLATVLSPGQETRIGSIGGRPLNTDMPYFNLEWGDQGMIVVLSWIGQWSSRFARDAANGLRIAGGQEKTHFRLFPGEEVRTPLIVLQFWEGGDVVRSQNIWRRWMIAHNLPRPGGKPFPPVLSASAPAELFPNLICNASAELSIIEGCAKRRLKFDYWWLDAGWYPCGDIWWNTGTWQPDPVRYPKGLREVADAAHANGMKFTVWFEPERAVPGSWLYQNHPEWLLGPDGQARLLDMGNPNAFKWLLNTIDKLITDNHIDMYRQDYNFDPIDHWRYKEPADRQGITEIRQVSGLLAYWDELKKRHPDMPFDNCAGGGRRNVLEMMRRGVPLSKSDLSGGTTSTQCQTYGIAPWLPYFGAGGGVAEDLYRLRSNIAPWIGYCYNTRRDNLRYDVIRRFFDEWREVIPFYWGDFYPLTSYSLEENVWMAWQFDMPEKGEGVVQAFRRDKNSEQARVFKLRGLDPRMTYSLKNFDTDKTEEIPGWKLMEQGLHVNITGQPGSALIVYRRE